MEGAALISNLWGDHSILVGENFDLLVADCWCDSVSVGVGLEGGEWVSTAVAVIILVTLLLEFSFLALIISLFDSQIFAQFIISENELNLFILVSSSKISDFKLACKA